MALMKKYYFLLVAIVFSNSISAQAEKTYHVNTEILNIRSGPNTYSEKIHKLKRYDNVLVLNDTISPGWYKIEFNGIEGYVDHTYLSRGKSIIYIQEYRTGAVCNDGTNSSATGRGACSHHGGVAYWKTKKQESVRIVED
jgi:uncharacterized protein YgiM (DUF1202 family)